MAKASAKPATKASKPSKAATKSKAPVKVAAKKKSAPAKAAAPSKFVWYEVMTTDTKAAEKFYASVVGWQMADAMMPDRSYTILSMGENMVAGLMAVPPDAAKMGVGPAWMGYVSVPDTDAAAKKLVAAGGTLHRPCEDIPGVGRMAVVSDPGGAGFILFTPNDTGQSKPVAPYTPGHIGWHDLRVPDIDQALKFYSKLFGWTKAEALDMGPMGIYQMFAINGVTVGGISKMAPEMKQAHWLYYVTVPGIDAAVAKVTKGKGKIVRPPHEVPGNLWISHCTDPQGAQFALVAPKR